MIFDRVRWNHVFRTQYIFKMQALRELTKFGAQKGHVSYVKRLACAEYIFTVHAGGHIGTTTSKPIVSRLASETQVDQHNCASI